MPPRRDWILRRWSIFSIFSWAGFIITCPKNSSATLTFPKNYSAISTYPTNSSGTFNCPTNSSGTSTQLFSSTSTCPSTLQHFDFPSKYRNPNMRERERNPKTLIYLFFFLFVLFHLLSLGDRLEWVIIQMRSSSSLFIGL